MLRIKYINRKAEGSFKIISKVKNMLTTLCMDKKDKQQWTKHRIENQRLNIFICFYFEFNLVLILHVISATYQTVTVQMLTGHFTLFKSLLVFALIPKFRLLSGDTADINSNKFTINKKIHFFNCTRLLSLIFSPEYFHTVDLFIFVCTSFHRLRKGWTFVNILFYW